MVDMGLDVCVGVERGQPRTTFSDEMTGVAAQLKLDLSYSHSLSLLYLSSCWPRALTVPLPKGQKPPVSTLHSPLVLTLKELHPLQKNS